MIVLVLHTVYNILPFPVRRKRPRKTHNPEPLQAAEFCFKAVSGSRYIAGLTWQFSIDGTEKTQGDGSVTRNCISVSTTKTTGSVAVQATAGGQSATVTLAVAQSARTSTPAVELHTFAPSLPVAGDRAAM